MQFLDLSKPDEVDGIPTRLDALPWALRVLDWERAFDLLRVGWCYHVGGQIGPRRVTVALPNLSGLSHLDQERAVVAAALRARGEG
ncbi:MAG: hypothetical protein EBS48_11480 [Actinobacteria bacterium]|nr:hypothetical protein [Actinomycetota bacterium]